MNYLLYTLENIDLYDPDRARPGINGYVVDCSPFSLRWLGRMLRASGIAYLRCVVLATWALLTRVARPGEIRVYAFVTDENVVAHYSVVSPTSMHMPWIAPRNGGIEVGGCLTIPGARGQGLYPYVLLHIARSRPDALPIYMIVEEGNDASRSGMLRAGFVQAKRLRRSRGGVKPAQFLIRSEKDSTDKENGCCV